MALSTWLRAPFRFAPVPVSLLAVIFYSLIFGSVLYTDQLFDVPKHTKGIDVDRAYQDLHKITARPHPFLSHANDDVRAYILSQLKPIAIQHPYVHLSEDLTSNASWVVDGRGIYYESTNILVRIDGTDAPLADPDAKPSGVLFSAHYDSVSTAPGATDDGMGVVTLLELVRYFSVPERRPRRTAVFFFNNGEEDGLNGAYLYWRHPWSKLTSSFVNLEGAASGGRPLLWRSTSLAPTRSFLSSAIAHLQADAVTADAYKRGVVRSYTDYQVYAAGLEGHVDPMEGIDVAFYKNRAFYHTPRDSITGMGYNEGRRALWAMMEGARGAALELLNNNETTAGEDHQPGVYFDLFRTKLVLFSLRSLFVTNVVFLVVGPVITLVLLAMVYIASKQSPQGRAAEERAQSGDWSRFKNVSRILLGWSHFWIALVVGVLAHVGLVEGFVQINPYVIHSHPYAVLLSFMSLSVVALVEPIQLLQHILPSPPSSQKLVVLLEQYFLTWVLLVVATAYIQKYQLGGVYWITAWHICAFLAICAALAEAVVQGMKSNEDSRKAGLDLTVENDYDESDETGTRHIRGVLYEAPERYENEGNEEPGQQHAEEEGEIVETEPTEITPLMHQHRKTTEAHAARARYDEYGWWVLQMVLSVPVVALLLFQVELLLLQALMNTLVDGSSPVNVYGGLAVLSTLIFVPLTPFAHKLHHGLTLAALIVFVITLIFLWTAFPFTQDKPFKVYFQQQMVINASSDSQFHVLPLVNGPVADIRSPVDFESTVQTTTVLTGLLEYVRGEIVPEMPSSWGRNVSCEEDKVTKPGLWNCGWQSDLVASPIGNLTANDDIRWLDFTATRLNSTSAIVHLGGTNTRGCRLYFDTPINLFHIRGSEASSGLLPGYDMPKGGVKQLRLWTRTWDKPFDVEVSWEDDGDDAPLQGRAACEWAEYASGSAGGNVPVVNSGLIPALEEVISFLPLWALPSKTDAGLVEVSTRFAI